MAQFYLKQTVPLSPTTEVLKSMENATLLPYMGHVIKLRQIRLGSAVYARFKNIYSKYTIVARLFVKSFTISDLTAIHAFLSTLLKQDKSVIKQYVKL
jgi:hypothetical protein